MSLNFYRMFAFLLIPLTITNFAFVPTIHAADYETDGPSCFTQIQLIFANLRGDRNTAISKIVAQRLSKEDIKYLVQLIYKSIDKNSKALSEIKMLPEFIKSDKDLGIRSFAQEIKIEGSKLLTTEVNASATLILPNEKDLYLWKNLEPVLGQRPIFAYVETAEGKKVLRTYPKQGIPKQVKGHQTRVYHSTLVGENEKLLCAGEIEILDGKITQINNFSGHYKPPAEQFLRFLDEFYETVPNKEAFAENFKFMLDPNIDIQHTYIPPSKR